MGNVTFVIFCATCIINFFKYFTWLWFVGQYGIGNYGVLLSKYVTVIIELWCGL